MGEKGALGVKGNRDKLKEVQKKIREFKNQFLTLKKEKEELADARRGLARVLRFWDQGVLRP